MDAKEAKRKISLPIAVRRDKNGHGFPLCIFATLQVADAEFSNPLLIGSERSANNHPTQ